MIIDFEKFRFADRVAPASFGATMRRATALMVLGAGIAAVCSGCAQIPESMTGAFVDPAKYDLYNCVQLRAARRENARRLAELEGYRARADTGVAGPAVAEVAYGNDLLSTRASAKLADDVWFRNHCDTQTLPPDKGAPPPAPAPDKDAKKHHHQQ